MLPWGEMGAIFFVVDNGEQKINAACGQGGQIKSKHFLSNLNRCPRSTTTMVHPGRLLSSYCPYWSPCRPYMSPRRLCHRSVAVRVVMSGG